MHGYRLIILIITEVAFLDPCRQGSSKHVLRSLPEVSLFLLVTREKPWISKTAVTHVAGQRLVWNIEERNVARTMYFNGIPINVLFF